MSRHVVHVVGTLQAGGVQKLIVGLAKTAPLHRDRHSVICVLGTHGELREEFEAAGVSIVACPFAWPETLPLPSYRGRRWLRDRLAFTFAPRFAITLRRIGADLVHTHLSSRVDAQAIGALRLAHLPLVWTVHGLYAPDAEDRVEWTRARTIVAGRRCQITADSGPVADNLVARDLVARDQIRIVHAGADVARFGVRSARQPGWRAARGIPDDAILFGTSGRLVEPKAHDSLVEAAALVATDPKIHIVIAGSGPLEANLRTQIAKHELHNVHLVGFQTDVPAVLRELDVFVLPSRSEGFPLALIEALASGLPCVATSVGGIREMLGADGGVVVPPDDPPALAEAMRAMLSTPTRTRYASRSEAIAAAFSFDACAAQFATIYGELAR